MNHIQQAHHKKQHNTRAFAIVTPRADFKGSRKYLLKSIPLLFFLRQKYCKMPPKRRTSLGRSTSASRRMAASRATETPEQTHDRLDDQRTRQATSRAAEAPEQGQT